MTPRPTPRQRERETPAELLLRMIAREDFGGSMETPSVAAINIGREAIALLREHSAIATNAKWAARRRSLLARAGDSQ